MFLLLARWLHKTHRNCTIIARSSTNTVDLYASISQQTTRFKVARYSFSGSIPPKFELELRRHKQTFRKIATTVV